MDAMPMSYAGFWKRFLAYLIDWIILQIVSFILFLPFMASVLGTSVFFASQHTDISDEQAGAAIGGLLALLFLTATIAVVIGWLYYALMESSSRGATLGKMALGIVVTDLQGNRISFGRATGRYFGKILSSLILSIGYIMAGFTQQKQALHDILAGCLVVNRT